jgi:protocatechuate 3,4-dioxygenase, alpha subunit
MSAPLTPSQTVGPFFGMGLPYAGGERIAPPGATGMLRIEGQVLDGEGEPVPDALIEIWQPDEIGSFSSRMGFGRCRTDPEGLFTFLTVKPGSIRAPAGPAQAPHLNVTVFARGLLRHLVTRMYFPDEPASNAADPVLNLVDPARRATLIARDDGAVLRFDIHLQGSGETPFFAI